MSQMLLGQASVRNEKRFLVSGVVREPINDYDDEHEQEHEKENWYGC